MCHILRVFIYVSFSRSIANVTEYVDAYIVDLIEECNSLYGIEENIRTERYVHDIQLNNGSSVNNNTYQIDE